MKYLINNTNRQCTVAHIAQWHNGKMRAICNPWPYEGGGGRGGTWMIEELDSPPIATCSNCLDIVNRELKELNVTPQKKTRRDYPLEKLARWNAAAQQFIQAEDRGGE